MRVFRVRVPRYQTIYGAMLVLAVAAGALTTLCFATLGRDELRQTPVTVQVSVVAAYLGVVAVLIVFAVRHHRLRVHTPLNRMSRLKRLLSRPGAEKRFPHRRMELLYRKSRQANRRRIRKTLKSCPPGTVMVMNGPPPAELPLPTGATVPFEPLQVFPAEERTLDLMILGYVDPTQLREQPKPEGADAPRSSKASLRQRLRLASRILLAVVATCALIAICVATAVRTTVYDPSNLVWGGVLALVVLVVVTRARATQWWQLPGGLALRRSAWWKRQPVIRCIRATEATLLLDLNNGLTCVSYVGQARLIPTNRVVQMAILTGWLSRVRPPSDAEILAALGSEPQADAGD